MIGTFRITRSPHDVAVSAVALVRNFAYNSITTANPIKVNVTAQNYGSNTESFAVWAKANSTLIGNQTITLNSGKSMNVTFNWGTAGSLVKGNYIITTNATKLVSELTYNNNQFIGGIFLVKLKGDVNGDCMVDISDLAITGSNNGKTPTSPGFNPNTDLNFDGQVDITDIVLVASSSGAHC